MKMDVKNMIGMVVAVVVGLIMIGPLVSVVSDAQTVNGDPIKITNAGSITADNELYITDDLSESHSFTAEYPNAYITVDDVQIPTANAVQGFYLISDGLSLFNTGAFFAVSFGEKTAQYNPAWNVALSATFEDGTATFTYRDGGTTNTYTTEYTWIGYRVTEGGNYVNKVNVATATYHDMSDFIAMGNYATGDNDTYYAVKDGKITLSETQYEGKISTITSTAVSGTTDLYTGTLRIYVDDEYFTPYVWAVAKEVNGHKSSGTMYDMLGIIPMLVTAGLIIGIAGAVFVRRLE